jgi:hypothetical protein
MSISEMLFYAAHPEEQEEEFEVEQVRDEQHESLEIQFDCLFLLDLMPNEKAWIFDLMRTV